MAITSIFHCNRLLEDQCSKGRVDFNAAATELKVVIHGPILSRIGLVVKEILNDNRYCLLSCIFGFDNRFGRFPFQDSLNE